MGLQWYNSAIEMLVNLNIKSFGELHCVFVHIFIQGLLYLVILCCQVFAIAHDVVYTRSYGLGGELPGRMFICDWPYTYMYILQEILEIACNDCSFCFNYCS